MGFLRKISYFTESRIQAANIYGYSRFGMRIKTDNYGRTGNGFAVSENVKYKAEDILFST